ncbi:MAG: flagellar motor switch protein FliN [Bdellovibrionales bacterium]|nr:flagellar motor switch protein FliN [Bdellovibrionales bacterium]
MGDIGAALASAAEQQAQGPAKAGAAPGAGGLGGQGGGAAKPKGQDEAAPVHSLDFILDIPLKVTVELGRSRMAIRDILQLAQGSVVELSKFAGEPLEVLVNEKLVARGEVVVVNEKFGVRLTDIISPVERIEQLK